jgi:hypothetical protein
MGFLAGGMAGGAASARKPVSAVGSAVRGLVPGLSPRVGVPPGGQPAAPGTLGTTGVLGASSGTPFPGATPPYAGNPTPNLIQAMTQMKGRSGTTPTAGVPPFGGIS